MTFGDSGVNVEMTSFRKLDITSGSILPFGSIASAVTQLNLAISSCINYNPSQTYCPVSLPTPNHQPCLY